MLASTLAVLSTLLPALVSAHGYLSSPPFRGQEKVATDIDAVKSPNLAGLCRGEPAGPITTVASGSPLTLGFTITAPHIGPCTVYLLDLDLSNPVQIDQKMNCAAPGFGQPWTVQLPQGVTGRKVLRWFWEARHVSPEEQYEQCVDLMLTPSGAAGPAGSYAGANDSVTAASSSQSSSSASSDSSSSSAVEAAYGNGAASTSYSANASNAASYQNSSSSSQSATYGSPAYGNAPSSAGIAPPPLAPAYAGAPSSASAYGAPASAYGAPAPAYGAPAPAYGTPAPAGCTPGVYECVSGAMFQVCSNGAWIQQACGVGTQCVPNGATSIVCGLSSQ